MTAEESHLEGRPQCGRVQAHPFFLMVGVKHTHGAQQCNICLVNKQTVHNSDIIFLQGIQKTDFAQGGGFCILCMNALLLSLNCSALFFGKMLS